MPQLDVNARAADITIEALGYEITGNGFIALQVRVTNQGDLASGPVVISADWAPDPDDDAGGTAGQE